MSGEKSKNTGEFGEELVSNFFELIGWKQNNVQRGVGISCNNNSHLNKNKNPKQTHGIDRLYTYECPLDDGTIKNAIVSVKYTNEKYPDSDTQKFKDHLLDLLETQECFILSAEKHNTTADLIFDHVEDIGVLFWLSHIVDGNNDFISIIENSQLPTNSNIGTTLIVDNNRLLFIYEAIQFTKAHFPNYNYSFYYPETGKNLSAIRKKDYGDFLPVEYLNCSILPIRIQNKNNPSDIELLLFSLDNFQLENLKQLIGLGQLLTKTWAGKTYICFKDYDALNQTNEVIQIKNSFRDQSYTNTVEVLNFKNTHLNINI